MSDDLRERVASALEPFLACPMSEALDAADAALAEMGAVRVKPLEWEAYNEIGHGRCHYGSGVFGHWYAVSRSAKAQWSCSTHHAGKMRHLGYFPTLEAAKAAAQADYEARILAAIEPAPVSVREAARVLLDEWRQGEGPLGELCCYSLDEGGTMQRDIDGRWVEFTKIEAALFRAIAKGKDDE